jgi:hypothetical protein
MRYSPEARREMGTGETGDRKLRMVSEGDIISIVDLTYYDSVSKMGTTMMDNKKRNLPCKDSGFELSRMTLHHIAM